MENQVSKNSEKKIVTRLVVENYVKIILFFILAVLLVVGNFWLENDLSMRANENIQVFSGVDDLSQEVIIPDNGVLRFDFGDENGAIENELKVISVDENKDEYVFDFVEGKMWGNFEYSNAKVNFVFADRIVLIPSRARFNLQFDGARVSVNVFDGDVYFGFLPDGVGERGYLEELSPDFVNYFLVSTDSQAVIPVARIDWNIQGIFNSKLMKEFRHAAISNEVRNSNWVVRNLIFDNRFAETLRQRADLYVGDAIGNGDNLVRDIGVWLSEKLTFIDNKKIAQRYEQIFSELMMAIAYADQGNVADMNFYFSEFVKGINDLPDELKTSEEIDGTLREYFDLLSLFGPESRRHVVFVDLLNSGVLSLDQRVVADYLWQDIYRAVPVNQEAINVAFVRYYEQIKKMIGSAKGTQDVHYLVVQNQLLDNLFLRDPLFIKENSPNFYSKRYFDMKSDFEKRLLTIVADPNELTELKQSMVDMKIRTLKMLRNFFFNEKMSVNDAREIIKIQFIEIDALLSEDAISGNNAIVDLFEVEISDIDDFWGYLNSPRYHSRSFGETHRERYEAYLNERDNILDIVTIKEDITGIPESNVSIEEIVDSIEGKFREQSQLSIINVGDISDASQRFVEVDGVIGGYAFKALYDRDQDMLRDVVAFNNIIVSEEGGVSLGGRVLRLNMLLDSIVAIFSQGIDDGENEVPGEQEGGFGEETFAQRAARIYIVDRLLELGFAAVLDNVSIANNVDLVYSVKGVYLKEVPGTKYEFDFVVAGEKVSNLRLVTDENISEREGEFVLSDLPVLVLGVSR